MSHDTPTIKAAPRERTGTRYAQRLRQSGRLPAVIYGHKRDTVHVSVDEREILDHLGHGSHVMSIDIDGHAPETCLVKDLQFGFMGDNVVHIDFARVNLDEEVEVKVHVVFHGEPSLPTNSIVRYDVNDLDVICKVTDIPDEIRVDVTAIEHHLTIADLDLPPGVRATADESTPVATVVQLRGEEEATGEEVETTGEAEPEVITEKKEDEASGE